MFKLEALNKAQRKAVMHGEGPLLVLAGPGSGKTFTITQRILYLIETMQVSPEEILVITFTKEAALSMQRRFQEQSEHTYPVNFGTFHSIFYHILNQSKGSQHSNNKQILQQSQKKHLLYPIVRKYLNESNNLSISESVKINSYVIANSKESISEAITMLISAISYFKNTGDMDAASRKLPQEYRNIFHAIYEEYESVRKRKNAMDFDDMVYECAELLEKDTQLRSYWQSRFTHILMDEFQDINPMQYRVIGLLTRPPHNLFAVGDDDQAIYGFRGSKPACLKQFQKEYGAEQVLLNVNYRSQEEIIKASLLVIGENKERFQKKLVAKETQQEAKCENMVHQGTDVNQDNKQVRNKESSNKQIVTEQTVKITTFQEREEQYQYLMNQFAQKKDNDTYAVLFRTNAYMQGFAIRLQREGIAFTMKEKAESIYENPIVKDIMAYFRVASGEDNRELWLRILNKPSRYISREALAESKEKIEEKTDARENTNTDINNSDIATSILEKIKAYYNNKTVGNSHSFLYLDKIRSAVNILEKQLGYLKKASPFLGVQYIRKVIGYEKYLKDQDNHKSESEQRFEEAMEILDWLSEDAKRYPSLEEWINAQEQYKKSIQEKWNNSTQKVVKSNAVKGQEIEKEPDIQLMTIHASKGLEFDRVWIPDCNEKVFPHGTIIDKDTCEEERRIFYVGMTRAKKSLELLCTTGTKERPRLISRFLNPLWKNYSSSSTTSSNSH